MCFGDASSKESTCQCRGFKGCEFRSLGWEDPLEEEMAPHSIILAWRIESYIRRSGESISRHTEIAVQETESKSL